MKMSTCSSRDPPVERLTKKYIIILCIMEKAERKILFLK